MRIPRVYCEIELVVGQSVELPINTMHHLCNVLRRNSKDAIIIFNGKGGSYQAALEIISKKKALAHIIEFNNDNAQSVLELHLAQSLIKSDKMDYVIQKSVELGVSTITPVLVERKSVNYPSSRLDKKIKHWQQIAIHASEQSGRTDIVKICEPVTIDTWTKRTTSQLSLILNPHSEKTLLT